MTQNEGGADGHRAPHDRHSAAASLSSAGPRLRAPARGETFHVVLVEPEIPPNTGNVARLCAATHCSLHLVHPLGFRVDEKAVRRAGLDYWHLVEVHEHASWDAFEATLASESRLHFFTGKTSRSLYSNALESGDYLVFGRESDGLPAALLERYADRTLGIPTIGPVRSLNLANSVALAVYEGLRQLGRLDEPSLG